VIGSFSLLMQNLCYEEFHMKILRYTCVVCLADVRTRSTKLCIHSCTKKSGHFRHHFTDQQ